MHHAVNDAYLDKNYGGILILWDRLFGTFKDEDDHEKCVYGTRGLLNSWDPLWANAQVYAGLAHDSWHAHRWADKLKVWIKPPGWRPADVAERFPKPAFSMAQMQIFQPPMSRAVQWFALVQFAVLLTGVGAFLWQADTAPLAHNAIWFAVLLVGQWALGAVMQGRIGMLMALMLQSAALATATSALGFTEWHWLFKPLTMIFALFLVAASAYSTSARGLFDSKNWLLLAAALAGSLAGDVFLMFQGFFIPGLVSFLVAHLFYVALFKRGQVWFPAPGGAGRHLGHWRGHVRLFVDGRPAPALRVPVAAYVLVIALMAGAGHGPGDGAAQRASTAGGAGGGVLHAERFLAGDRPVCDAPAMGPGVGAVHVLRSAGADRQRLAGARSAQQGSSQHLRLPCSLRQIIFNKIRL